MHLPSRREWYEARGLDRVAIERALERRVSDAVLATGSFQELSDVLSAIVRRLEDGGWRFDHYNEDGASWISYLASGHVNHGSLSLEAGWDVGPEIDVELGGHPEDRR